MGRGGVPTDGIAQLRSLPRCVIPGATMDEEIALPEKEKLKFQRVLRLQNGTEIAVVPGDGTIIRAKLNRSFLTPVEQVQVATEAKRKVRLAQALPKGDKIDEIVRACTEIGVHEFLFFSSERTVVRWDEGKLQERLRRLRTIAMEACEVSFRTMIPGFLGASNLADVLDHFPGAVVLSESDQELKMFRSAPEADEVTIVVGPEGGWSPVEMKQIGNRGFSLGPRVLRVEHAGPAAAAILLLG